MTLYDDCDCQQNNDPQQGNCEGQQISPVIRAVFVYGTLKTGQCRANRWPLEPLSIHPAWTRGTLYGRDDYPAMTEGADRVLGELWQFAETQMELVLKRLDEIEGTGPHRFSTHRHITVTGDDNDWKRHHRLCQPLL